MDLYSLNEAFYIRQTMNPLSAGQIALWHAIARVANKSHWQEWFSVANITLVQLSGLSLAGVKQARNVLKQHGLIDFKPNGTKATLYLVNDIAHGDMQESSRVCSRNSGRNSSGVVAETVAESVAETVAHYKYNTEQNIPPISPKGEAGEGFAAFWAEYPRHTAKAVAVKSWQKINPDASLQESIMDGLRRQKTSVQWQRDGGKYIPHPSTWLNQRRWEDETEAVQQETPQQQIRWID